MPEAGVAVAVGVENKDDSDTGRLKVRYPGHSQPPETYWARVATPMAGKSRGFYFIPEVGDEVIVAYTLRFDDGEKGRVQLESSDGKHLSIDDDEITLEDANGNGFTIQAVDPNAIASGAQSVLIG